MPTIHINPVQGTDTGTGSSAQPFRTWAKVNPLLAPGVDVVAGDGSYVDSPSFALSGTRESPIRILGKGAAKILRSINLASRQWIELHGLNLHSKTSGWLHSNGSSEYHILKNLRLTNEYVATAALPYAGALLMGRYHKFTDSSVEGWLRGDAVQLDADYTLVQDVDFSKCNAVHGGLITKGSYNVVRGSSKDKPMVFTNRWDRPMETMQFGNRGEGKENLFENLRIVHSNWDGKYPPPPSWHGGQPGALQLFKIGGDGNIYRDIEIEFNYAGGFTATQSYAGIMHVGNFSGGEAGTYLSANFRHQRFYRMKINDNPWHVLTVTRNATLPYDYDDNIWFNCVFKRNKDFLHATADGVWVDQQKFHHNVIEGKFKRGSRIFDLAQYQAQFPNSAWANTDGSTTPQQAPLTTVSQAGQSATVNVRDARPIFCGNGGVHEGDSLVIGKNQPVVALERVSPTQIRVSRAIVVAVGDEVWEEAQFVDTAPVPEPEPEPEPQPPTPDPVTVPEEEQPVVVKIRVSVWVNDVEYVATVQEGPEASE